MRAEGLTPFCRVSEAQHVSSLCASTWPGAEVGSPALSAQVGRSGLAGHATGGSAGPRWPVVSLVPPSKHLATCPHAPRLRKSQTPQVQVLELPSTAKDQLVCTSAAGAVHWEVALMWHRRGIDVAAVALPQWPPLQCSESQVDALRQPHCSVLNLLTSTPEPWSGWVSRRLTALRCHRLRGPPSTCPVRGVLLTDVTTLCMVLHGKVMASR